MPYVSESYVIWLLQATIVFVAALNSAVESAIVGGVFLVVNSLLTIIVAEILRKRDKGERDKDTDTDTGSDTTNRPRRDRVHSRNRSRKQNRDKT